jgi:hypothetical protein
MNGGASYMRVQATNPTGTLNVGGDSLMVVRTENSQGLTDTGTLSAYVRQTGVWSLDLNFSFFSDASLTTAAPLGLQLTSFDIDHSQRYYVSNSSFTHNVLSSGTSITAASPISGYTGFTSAGPSAFNNPNTAVASWGYGSSFNVRLANTGVALFMFEFRQPSEVTGLAPEPSSALLALTGVMAFALKRRRQRAA